MTNNPTISIIMTVYNSEKFLNEAITSLLNQTYKNFELIIINDFSNDRSLEIINKFLIEDERIVLINNETNIGCTKSRNKGLKKARGKFIAILDSDDIALPERLEIQYKYLEKNKNIFLSGSSVFIIDESGKNIGTYISISNSDKVSQILLQRNCIYHSSIMFRNENKYLYRDKFTYSQDYDFYLCLLSEGKKLSNSHEVLIKYRINSNAISWTKNTKQKLFAEKAKEFYNQRTNHGKDDYNQFDQDEILNIDIEKSTNRIVLENEVKENFKIFDFVKARNFCKKYFDNYGIFNKMLVYYLMSFAGKKNLQMIKNIRNLFTL